jgi:hypothetical protein
VASRTTRSSRPQPGHCGEVAGQGEETRSSPQQWVDDEGGGGGFGGGVPVTGSSFGGDDDSGDVLEHLKAKRG